jgi:signal transduction histidine kinase
MRSVNEVSDRAGTYVVPSETTANARDGTGPPAPPQRHREICHDMRQPVAGVLSLAAAALSVPELPSAARSRLEQIITEAQSLAELIEQSLDRHDRKASALRTDLRQLAGEVMAGARVTYPGVLRMTAPPRPVLVDATRVDLRRIVGNLLGNATRAAGPDGCVAVRVARDGDCGQLVVQDSGPGFARIRPGTGLGIGVIARCLARCGGQIDYRPSSAGGVKATVSLPLARD